MIRAGHLREQVTFQRLVQQDDGHGNATNGWANIEVGEDVTLTVWADVLERLGGERLSAGAMESTRMATIRVRGEPDILTVTEADRIVARGRNWNIRAISEVGRSRELIEFLCETGTVT